MCPQHENTARKLVCHQYPSGYRSTLDTRRCSRLPGLEPVESTIVVLVEVRRRSLVLNLDLEDLTTVLVVVLRLHSVSEEMQDLDRKPRRFRRCGSIVRRPACLRFQPVFRHILDKREPSVAPSEAVEARLELAAVAEVRLADFEVRSEEHPADIVEHPGDFAEPLAVVVEPPPRLLPYENTFHRLACHQGSLDFQNILDKRLERS